MLSDFLPIFFQVLIAIGFAAIALTLSVLLGQRSRRTEGKDSVYECGMLPIGAGSPRFSVKFYLVAMLFVIFDIEAVFMISWAVQFQDLIKENTAALFSMASFAIILLIAYLYAFGKGALNWNH